MNRVEREWRARALTSSIAEGVMRLRSGVDALGRRLPQPMLDAVRREVERARAELAALTTQEASE